MSEKLTRTQQKNLERLGGVNPADESFSRRQFVSQVGGYAAVAGGAVAAGLLVRDRWGMEGAVKPPPPVKLKDYSTLHASRPNMVVVRSPTLLAESYASKDEETQAREDQALKMVKAAMEEMGGENGVRHFATKGDVIMIKPNVAFDKNPYLGAVLARHRLGRRQALQGGRRLQGHRLRQPDQQPRELLLQDQGRRRRSPSRLPELMMPQDSYFEQLYVGGETITNTWRMFYRPFREATKVIGISPVKDHNLCKATVTLKNWYGLLGNPRNQFHQNIHGIISDFALMMKPTLVIADGRRLLMRNGPTGEQRQRQSRDPTRSSSAPTASRSTPGASPACSTSNGMTSFTSTR